MENFFNYTKEMLATKLVNDGFKSFMATQIFEWVYEKKEYNPEHFSNIKKENQDYLKRTFCFDFITLEKVEEDVDVKKFLFRLKDGEKIETVLMKHNYGNSVCISSQVGCNMGCKFCESGRLKKVRNLETYEMVEELILVEDYIKEKINSCVIMGIGEPFDNYDNVINFLKIINDPKSLNIGARHITVSTCGIVPKILEFAKLPLQVNLAISLHAPNDEIRNKIMPISKAYSLEELMSALDKYYNITNRRVTIEYIMLKGINDSVSCAKQLASLLQNRNVYVNLIPYNETSNIDFSASDKSTIDKFFLTLKENNIDVTIRRRFGSKISAACGQLRSKEV